ncbi:50S ribosomal subunit protein L6 [Candidatus Tremblaya phenacola PAVE]|nr:50S ribosomal subunit protein L6 [Candidatus Tremblaya phenacola PAVE]
MFSKLIMSKDKSTALIELRGTKISLMGTKCIVNGPLGHLPIQMAQIFTPFVVDGVLIIQFPKDSGESKMLLGTTKSLLSNIINGVTEGHRGRLILCGIGFKATNSMGALQLQLGFSKPVLHQIKKRVIVTTPTPNEIEIFGLDKQLVKQESTKIKKLRPSESYKGRGIRFHNEPAKTKERKKSK